LADAHAEYLFLQVRLSYWIRADNPITVQGNLLSAALALYQGAVLGGIVGARHIPQSMLAVAGLVGLFSDGPPRFPGKVPPTRGVGGPGDIGEVDEPIQMTLRGRKYTMPDWHMEKISYTKRTDAARLALRAQFGPVREAFLKDLAKNDAAALQDAGFSDEDIALMANGKAPQGYQVHHTLPLDDGGTNAPSNLMLIKNDPDHQLITNYQNGQTREMSAGQTRTLELPRPDSRVRFWPKTPDGGAYPTVHKLEWLMPDSRVRIWPKTPGGSAYFHRALTRRTSMSDVDDLLAAINAELREFAQTISPPASPEAIERLRRYARDTFRTNLPEGYVTFLGRNDGLDFNGFVIYAATECKKPFLSGFVEANERLGAPDNEYVFYGESGDELYAQHQTSMAWVALDRPSLSVLGRFPSFDAMLAHVLREAVE
jgi:hypothetical protein